MEIQKQIYSRLLVELLLLVVFGNKKCEERIEITSGERKV